MAKSTQRPESIQRPETSQPSTAPTRYHYRFGLLLTLRQIVFDEDGEEDWGGEYAVWRGEIGFAHWRQFSMREARAIAYALYEASYKLPLGGALSGVLAGEWRVIGVDLWPQGRLGATITPLQIADRHGVSEVRAVKLAPRIFARVLHYAAAVAQAHPFGGDQRAHMLVVLEIHGVEHDEIMQWLDATHHWE